MLWEATACIKAYLPVVGTLTVVVVLGTVGAQWKSQQVLLITLLEQGKFSSSDKHVALVHRCSHSGSGVVIGSVVVGGIVVDVRGVVVVSAVRMEARAQ